MKAPKILQQRMSVSVTVGFTTAPLYTDANILNESVSAVSSCNAVLNALPRPVDCHSANNVCAVLSARQRLWHACT